MRVALSRRAETDIADIAHYTVSEWGEAQADRYVMDLTDGDRLLVLGRPFPGKRALLRATVGSHFVFFRVRNDHLFVARVLHRRSDVVRHLP